MPLVAPDPASRPPTLDYGPPDPPQTGSAWALALMNLFSLTVYALMIVGFAIAGVRYLLR
jgi:hypothetical protein